MRKKTLIWIVLASFAIGLFCIVPNVSATQIEFGKNIYTSIGSETEMDAYTFSANAGNSVVIRMKSSWYSGPEIRLYAPNGSLISRGNGRLTYSSEITEILPYEGKYTLIAEDYDGDSTGNYSLYLNVMGINVPPPTDEVDKEKEIPGVPTTPVEKEEKETPEVPTTPCESDQLFFQGKCIEISSLFEKDKDKEGINEEQYRSIIENFDNLKKEDRGKLEKLADYLESEIKNTLDNHEYEAAKTYTSLL